MNIELKAEYVCEFIDFNNWVNKASSWIGGYPRDQKVICIDINGNALTNGLDFMKARDNDLFPVKAYRLIRVSETILTHSA